MSNRQMIALLITVVVIVVAVDGVRSTLHWGWLATLGAAVILGLVGGLIGRWIGRREIDRWLARRAEHDDERDAT